MMEAVRQGVAGTGEHSWFFSDSFGLVKAYSGVGELTSTGIFPGVGQHEICRETVATMRNAADMRHIEALLPESEADHPFLADGSYTHGDVSSYSPFLYEAVVALGLSACSAYDENPSFTGIDHFAHFANTTFIGIGGKVDFEVQRCKHIPIQAYKLCSGRIHRSRHRRSHDPF